VSVVASYDDEETIRDEEREAAAQRASVMLDELWSLMVNTDGDPVFRNVVLRWVGSKRDQLKLERFNELYRDARMDRPEPRWGSVS
jgi:hypothetical protein